ncbi:GlsB/YeaQ/YmgE family stress response membrane protein [Terrimonas rubra]|uniref:GlsB/YeaQ/YmgE family stress response membrane protein n=1 Tax=Terrimonas rubra TaxID=1035890 RepID=A0ABW6A7C9_9BACT
MDLTSVLIFLAIGAIAGWLAGLLFKGSGFGLLGNIVVGIVGGFFGGWLAPKVGITFGGGIIGSILLSALGAIILLIIINLFRRD